MSNGNITPTSGTAVLLQILQQHGPWAVGCVAACAALYIFALKPMTEDRGILLTTLRENLTHQQEHMATIATSTEAIARSTERQESVLNGIQGAVADLQEFTETVRTDHPRHEAKLDAIIDKLDAGG